MKKKYSFLAAMLLSGSIAFAQNLHTYEIKSKCNPFEYKERVQVSHILLRLGQKASAQEQRVAQARIDSIYQVLKQGASFATLARQYSDDEASAKNGGRVPGFSRGQTVKSFEDVAFSLKEGEMSKPFLSEYGYHIVWKNHAQLGARRQLGEYPLDKENPEELLENEFYNSEVWAKASQDKKAVEAFYAKNKKKYKGVIALLKKKYGKKHAEESEYLKDLVLADYQDLLEKQWIENMKRKNQVVTAPRK